jgi:hypothetical protein
MNLQEQISRIQSMMGVISENNDDYVFIRTEKFDNKGTVNKLPYEGIHCWFIKKNDIPKYTQELELLCIQRVKKYMPLTIHKHINMLWVK